MMPIYGRDGNLRGCAGSAGQKGIVASAPTLRRPAESTTFSRSHLTRSPCSNSSFTGVARPKIETLTMSGVPAYGRPRSARRSASADSVSAAAADPARPPRTPAGRSAIPARQPVKTQRQPSFVVTYHDRQACFASLRLRVKRKGRSGCPGLSQAGSRASPG